MRVEPQFRILGPIEVAAATGATARVPRGRTLSLLALLLLERGAVVHVDRALDELWEGERPRHGRKAVHVVASRLRSALGEGILRSEGVGYALRMAPGDLDADRFEALVRDGRAQLAAGEPWEAAAVLGGALELWRGPALADVADARFAQPEIARLEDLRLACVSDRIDAELACGRHAEVVGELEGLVREHPLRERLRGQQMLALYRAGRQAEALEAYRRAYEALVDGLGIEPSPDLRALEAAILRHEVPAAERKPLPSEARRLVTCVFAQLADAGNVAGRDAESLRAVLERFHDDAVAICSEHDGAVVEARSDAVLAVFGAPVAHEDAAARAVRSAVSLVARTRELPRGLLARCGAATGEVVAAGHRGATAVVGEAVGDAERLGRAAAPAEIRLDARTWRIVRHAGRATPLVDGGFRLEGFDPEAPAIRRMLDRPLVGRDDDLRRLRDAFERTVATATAHVVALVGESGIGKSRLAAELEAELGSRATFLTGRCTAHGRGMTYWPLRSIVEQVAGDRPMDEVAASLGVPPAAVRQVAAAVGLREGGAGEDTAWAFLRVIEALARRRPLVLVLDDAHLAEPALVELLAEMAERLPGAPALVIAAARRDALDERHPGWEGLFSGGDCFVELGPLSRAAVGELLDSIEGGRLAVAERERIVAAAGGNPLYLEQLVAWLDENDAPAGELPPALHALLASRLDRLEATQRSALALGAVVGETFDPRAVQALAEGVSRAEVEQACEHLVARELLVRGEGGALRFRHGLVREVAYASLAKTARAGLHERQASWLEGLGEGLPEADARIGFHLEAACRYQAEIAGAVPAPLASAAARRLAAAARLARARGDPSGEVAFLSRAVALVGSERAEGAELLPDLVAALIEAGDNARAEEVARRAVSSSAALGLPGLQARSAIESARVRLLRHPESFDVATATAVVEDAVRVLPGDMLGQARADYLMADLAYLRGDAVACYHHSERMLGFARRADSGLDIATALVFMTWCLVEGPFPVPEGLARYEALHASDSDLRAVQLADHGCRAVLATMTGGWSDAGGAIAEARAGLAELHLSGVSYYMALLAGLAATLAGDAVAAERAALDAEGLITDPSDRWYLTMTRLDTAHAILAQGRGAGGTDARAEAAVAGMDEYPAPCSAEWVIKRHTARALLALRRGEPERGLWDARAAVDVAEGTSLALSCAEAHRTLAELLVAVGDGVAASSAVRRALELHEAKANAVSAAATRAQFGELLALAPSAG